ncbi:MAG TPA: DMT family transporter, partial [Acidimicrobiales bacterium]|nr:DMT family transporter [Acidimicrobiales bacterium]
ASAFSNAFNVVSQHAASTAAAATAKGWRLAIYLVRQPLWLLGVVAMVGGFVFQALALYNGRLSVVQPLLVTELIFSLVLGRWWLRHHVALSAWASASVTCIGLAIFLVMSEPQGGHASPTKGAWVSAIATMAGLVAVLTLAASRGSPVRRAGLYASAAGIVWATMATFIKSATDDLSGFGPLGVFEHGSLYAVIVAGIAGTVLTQAALHHGPLGVSQPVMVTTDPFVSVILGVWLFGEHFTHQPIKVAAGLLAFVIMAVGVLLMCRTAPALETAGPSRRTATK